MSWYYHIFGVNCSYACISCTKHVSILITVCYTKYCTDVIRDTSHIALLWYKHTSTLVNATLLHENSSQGNHNYNFSQLPVKYGMNFTAAIVTFV